MLPAIDSTDQAPLKVLTPAFSQRLRVFNDAARALKRMGARLERFEPLANSLGIDAEVGRRLLQQRLVEGFERYATAGSTRYRVQFMGITLEWREAISYLRPEEWANNRTH